MEQQIPQGLIQALSSASPRPVCAWVFGSVARGESTAASDLDIAVLYEHEPPATLAGSGLVLAGELEKHTSRPVDLVVMNKAPADLVHRVLRDGQLLFDYAPSLRIRFEVKRRAEFIDLLPYLREYRRFNPERLR